MKLRGWIVVISGMAVMAGAFSLADAQNENKKPQGGDTGFPDLVGALKEIPGCLGVEEARTKSGKELIFAWFEDKDACLDWYYSDVHQELQRRFFPGIEYGEPLQGVPDDVGPIMAVASITPSKDPRLGDTQLPISQISIELYKPLTGGLYLGGRFAPEKLKVGNMRNYTPKRKGDDKSTSDN